METRKYFEFYNTLNETYQYMSNEEKLLNSISKNFPEAIKNKVGLTNARRKLSERHQQAKKNTIINN